MKDTGGAVKGVQKKKNQGNMVSHQPKDKNISKGGGTELKNVQRT